MNRNRSNSRGSQTHGSQSTKVTKPCPPPRYKDSEVDINPPSTNVQLGEATDSRRDPPTRMLDRIARQGREAIPKRGTPHIAAVLLDNEIHLAGNSGKKRVKEEDKVKANTRILNITSKGKQQSDWDEKKGEQQSDRSKKDESKLSALMEGKYHPGDDKSGDLSKIKGALEGNSLKWHQVGDKGSNGGSKHGEMALHTPISEYVNKNSQNKDENKKPIPVAGVKKDCLFCQWAHAILNKYVYAELGYQVMTSGTHGTPFPNWVAPQELMSNDKARNAFKEKLTTLNKDKDNNELWSMDEKGKVTSSFKDKMNIHNSHDPYESDSE